MNRIAPLALLFAAAACSDGGSLAPPTAPRVSSPVSFERSKDDEGGQTFTSIDVPGAVGTFALAINSRGVVVGRYLKDGVTHGFLRSTTGELTTIDFPGAAFTVAAGINRRGVIVGHYALPGALNRRHGYILRDGVFTTIDPAGSNWTNVLGINDRGLITGRYCTLDVCRRTGLGDFHGFMYRDGEFTTIDVPGSRETNAWKSNTRGQIAGAYGDAGGTSHLFTLWHGEFTTFDLPGALPINQDDGGINARGDRVGVYCEFSPCEIGPTRTHGYLLRHGELTVIDYPGAAATGTYGINSRGDMIGAYYDAAGRNHGYLLTSSEREEDRRDK